MYPYIAAIAPRIKEVQGFSDCNMADSIVARSPPDIEADGTGHVGLVGDKWHSGGIWRPADGVLRERAAESSQQQQNSDGYHALRLAVRLHLQHFV